LQELKVSEECSRIHRRGPNKKFSRIRKELNFFNVNNIVTNFISALPGNSSVNTNRGNNRREIVFSMRSAPSKSTDIYIGSLLPDNAAVNMHPRQW
jgi:hypothetical protein